MLFKVSSRESIVGGEYGFIETDYSNPPPYECLNLCRTPEKPDLSFVKGESCFEKEMLLLLLKREWFER